MSPENNPKISNSPQLERLHSSQERFLSVLIKYDFPPEIIDIFRNEVLPGLEYEVIESGAKSNFYDVGLIEFGVSDGRYQIVISRETVKSRAYRLKNKVSEGAEEELALDWIMAHELGHAMVASYGLLHQTEQADGLMAGLPVTADTAENYLTTHPDVALGPDFSSSKTIERERQCEGFARLVLEDNLIKLGNDKQEASLIADSVYESRAAALSPIIDAAVEDPEAAHNVGYANPLTFEELVERFK